MAMTPDKDVERLLTAFNAIQDPKIRAFYIKLGETFSGLAPLSELSFCDLHLPDLCQHEPSGKTES